MGEYNKNEDWKPVLIVFRDEDREEILNVLADKGIPGIARPRAQKQKQVNGVVLVTGGRKRGEEICVAFEHAEKAEQIITLWMEKKQAQRQQERSAFSFLTGKNDGVKGKILTVAVVVIVILIYMTRFPH